MKVRKIGATPTSQGVHYCVWAPLARLVQVMLDQSGNPRILELKRDGHGYHRVLDPAGQAGDRYGYLIDGKGPLPDPASRAQAESIEGWSLVVDAAGFSWNDRSWSRPPFRDLVLYELHLGTFTPEGTLAAAKERLADLQSLGITAIELMPLADFPGKRSWGYDGVLIYAPARPYGTPDDLRRFVDAAHTQGIAVILDVVYNHFGPAGNILARYSPYYFSESHVTPWGAGFNFDGKHKGPVREFFLGNVRYWMKEFHIDGFRLDATHEIRDDSPVSILTEIAAEIHRRGGYVMAEDPRNERRLITPSADQGYGLDAVWADDFHHIVRVAQTKDRSGYFENFEGTFSELTEALSSGWLYAGQLQLAQSLPRGTKAGDLPPERFIHCLSNHDQTGNQPFGKRLHQFVSPRAYRALSALLCLSPYTPLLFMGQEWAASSPFLYFTDHEAELGKLITEGRRKEFAYFPEFSDPTRRDKIPDPQAATTFDDSKLDWQEREKPPHAGILELYRACLHLRRQQAAFRPRDRSSWRAENWPGPALGLHLEGKPDFLVVFDLWGGSNGSLLPAANWKLVLSSEEVRFGGDGAVFLEDTEWAFDEPGLIVLQAK